MWKNKYKGKYGAKRVAHHSGYSFASKLEASVFDLLKQREENGEISELKTQQRVYLVKDPDIYYIPDFSFIEDGELIYGEAKGFETPEYKIKLKLWRHFVENKLYIWGGTWQNPKIKEIVIPKKYKGKI